MDVPYRKKITKVSELTGKRHTMEIAVTDRQLAKWAAGGLIQDVMPHLTPSEREFIMTGVTPEEWEEEFGRHAKARRERERKERNDG